ncbi:MAG: hypothetical protein AB8B63_16990 [Granulosicoccus sp.]
MFDFEHPWFRPLWRRVLTTGIAVGWGSFEMFLGNSGWGTIFLALGAYTGYKLLVTYSDI